MRRLLLLLLAQAILATPSSAYNMTWYVYDINTATAQSGATITAVNATAASIGTVTTDSLGYASLSLDPINPIQVNYTVTKIGYFQYQNTASVTNADIFHTVAFYPATTDGIIRLRFDDMTLSVEQVCVFYKSNMRLQDCYYANETIQLSVNTAYLLRPRGNVRQLINSPSALGNYAWFYVGWLIQFTAFIAVLGFFILYLRRMITK